MKLQHNFIRLPLRFDVEQLKKELAYFDKQTWMPHPNDLKGNSAMPLISKGGRDNDDFHGAMQVTPHLKRCEYMQQILASFGEVFGRSRLMKLGPGCEVSLHTDTNHHWHSRVRIHIPITTNPEVIFHCGKSKVHMQAGECWIFDAWQQHKVVNSSQLTRVHLVIDTSGSSRFWQMVDKSEVIDVQQGPDDNLLEYEKGKKVTIATERFNVTPVMSPGELDGLVDGLVVDFMANPKNNKTDAQIYVQFLHDLSKDWRSLFYLHGYEESGDSAYAAFLKHSNNRMQLLPDNVTTESNSILVRDIIFFKILSMAFVPPIRQDFINQNPAQKPRTVTARPATAKQIKISRNDPCPCDSGKKYKHCHGLSH